MTAATFPNVLPDFTRSFTLPTFGVTIKSTKESEVRTLGTELGIGAKMALEYKNRTAVEFNTITAFYRQMRGTWGSFFVPVTIWRQPFLYQDAVFDLVQNSAFRFESPPVVQTVKRDVYDFTLNLITVPATAVASVGVFPSNIVA